MFYNQNPYNAPRPSFASSLKSFFHSHSVLNRLIIINVAVYLLYLILSFSFSLISFLMDNTIKEVFMRSIENFLACPADFHRLLVRPWTLFTSLFTHFTFWHLFFNMIMLSVAGRIFTEYLSEKQLLLTYLLGGVFGNLFYMACYNLFPAFIPMVPLSSAIGASGSIMAVLGAITLYRPNHKLNLFLLGTVKLVWLTVIFIVIDIISIPQGNAGGHLAHLGGVMYGAASVLFYLHYPLHLKKNKHVKGSFKKKKKRYSTSYDYVDNHPLSDEEYNARKVAEQKQIDAILDKISKNGYGALSKEERDILFHYSKK